MNVPNCGFGHVQPYMFDPPEPESGSEEEDSDITGNQPHSSQSATDW